MKLEQDNIINEHFTPTQIARMAGEPQDKEVVSLAPLSREITGVGYLGIPKIIALLTNFC